MGLLCGHERNGLRRRGRQYLSWLCPNRSLESKNNKLEVVKRTGDWALTHVNTMELNIGCSDIEEHDNKLYIACMDGIKVFGIQETPLEPIYLTTKPTYDKSVIWLKGDEQFLYGVKMDQTTVAYQYGAGGALKEAGKHNVDHWVNGVKYDDRRVYSLWWVWLTQRKYE